MSSNKSTFYSAHTVLFIIAIIVCITTWLIPAGQYDRIEYQKNKNEFVLQGKNSTTVLPATQNTLSKLGLNIEIQNFTNGKIFKPIAVPNTGVFQGSCHHLAYFSKQPYFSALLHYPFQD